MRVLRALTTVLAVAAGPWLWPASAADTVDVALILAVDVSSSMDADEQLVQRQGYVAAFRDPEVIRAIGNGLHGKIAIAYVEWAAYDYQAVTIPWRILSSRADVLAFAADLAAAPITTQARTSISGGLMYAADLFDQAPFQAVSRTIDMSGDGANNDGRPVLSARKITLSRGIVINGLPIAIRPTSYYGTFGSPTLEDYYRECVIGGPGSFSITVKSVDGFESAIRRKLVLEIAGTAPGVTPFASAADLVAPISAPGEARRRVDCLIGERARGGNR